MPGRPRTFDRSAALELALDAFWERGYERTSIAELTETMGIAAPSLYAAFGDKRALFEEATAAYGARMYAGLETALAETPTRAAVERLLRVTAEAHTARACPRGCLVMSEPGLGAERAVVRDAIRERLRHGRDEAGDLPAAIDVDAFADLLSALLAGMSVRARDGATRADLDAAIDPVLSVLPA